MTLEDYSKIAIGTTTFYNKGMPNGELRAGLAEKVIKTAVDSGYKMIVVDGSPEEWFPRSIEGSGAIIHRETPGGGMGGSRRECIQYAHDLGTPVVAWMEPEKLDYVKEVIKTAIPILEGKADLVIPDARIMALQGYYLPHYPTSQRNEELYGDDCWRELTSMDLDIWRGPKTWAREETPYFLKYDGKNHFLEVNEQRVSYGDKWDSIVIPVMQMALDGKRVIGVKVNYIHPKEQTEFEEGNFQVTLKRLDQLTNLVPAFTDYWNKNYPTSKLRKIREAD
ncbi:hypothetical protein KAT80_03645 [Candidatus Pacearchaeota archaeon]|nr:hypothetical protein [Candidatus Pacearchaeota archaeon]